MFYQGVFGGLELGNHVGVVSPLADTALGGEPVMAPASQIRTGRVTGHEPVARRLGRVGSAGDASQAEALTLLQGSMVSDFALEMPGGDTSIFCRPLKEDHVCLGITGIWATCMAHLDQCGHVFQEPTPPRGPVLGISIEELEDTLKYIRFRDFRETEEWEKVALLHALTILRRHRGLVEWVACAYYGEGRRSRCLGDALKDQQITFRRRYTLCNEGGEAQAAAGAIPGGDPHPEITVCEPMAEDARYYMDHALDGGPCTTLIAMAGVRHTMLHEIVHLCDSYSGGPGHDHQWQCASPSHDITSAVAQLLLELYGCVP